jgi:hypothetical protein
MGVRATPAGLCVSSIRTARGPHPDCARAQPDCARAPSGLCAGSIRTARWSDGQFSGSYGNGKVELGGPGHRGSRQGSRDLARHDRTRRRRASRMRLGVPFIIGREFGRRAHPSMNSPHPGLDSFSDAGWRASGTPRSRHCRTALLAACIAFAPEGSAPRAPPKPSTRGTGQHRGPKTPPLSFGKWESGRARTAGFPRRPRRPHPRRGSRSPSRSTGVGSSAC